MSYFAIEFAERVKNGSCGMRVWPSESENPGERLAADRLLANWLSYFDQRGCYDTARFWRERARNGHPLVMPNCEPWAYDLTFNGRSEQWRTHPSEQWAETRVGKHATEQTAEERRETVESAMVEVRKAARHMEMFPNEPRRKDYIEPPKPKTLDDLKREAEENPVKMSPGLAAHLEKKRVESECGG